MPMSQTPSNKLDRTGAPFPVTVWPVTQDLEALCKLYWPPIYAFLRRTGKSPEDAKDLTQGFFVHILARSRLERAHPEGGRFRTWLLKCLKRYLLNEWDKLNAERRGRGIEFVSINIPEAEHVVASCLSGTETPEQAYDRQWRGTLMKRVVLRLREEYAKTGELQRFDALYPFVTDEAERGDYAKVAANLRIKPGTVRKAAHDLREKFKSLLREEIAQTADLSEIEQETYDLAPRQPVI
jgi:RNA polymerase sigma factor (sigma-70 family)